MFKHNNTLKATNDIVTEKTTEIKIQRQKRNCSLPTVAVSEKKISLLFDSFKRTCRVNRCVPVAYPEKLKKRDPCKENGD